MDFTIRERKNFIESSFCLVWFIFRFAWHMLVMASLMVCRARAILSLTLPHGKNTHLYGKRGAGGGGLVGGVATCSPSVAAASTHFPPTFGGDGWCCENHARTYVALRVLSLHRQDCRTPVGRLLRSKSAEDAHLSNPSAQPPSSLARMKELVCFSACMVCDVASALSLRVVVSFW